MTEPAVAVGVPPRPPALPIATTASPIATFDGVGEAHRLEARDVVDLEERDVVDDVVAEHLGRVGLAGVDDLDADVVAPSITWLLVSTSPDDVMIMPVPAASPGCSRC